MAKQRELSGNLEIESDIKVKKLLSDAKTKELSGNDIFGPPEEVPPRSLVAARSMESKESKDMGEPAPRTVRTSVRVSNVSCLHNSLKQMIKSWDNVDVFNMTRFLRWLLS